LVVLRALAEGRIGWAFWPPDSTLHEIASVANGEGMGIWIPRGDMDFASDQEPESEEEEVDENGNGNDKHATSSEDSELDGDIESGSDGGRKVAGIGRFDALAINESDEEQDESDG
jgi:hypothetical protein